jgi:fructokinase
MSGSSVKRPVIFGEVLFDRFADGSVVLGGAPFNVAWHLHAFGQHPLFISRVGDDPLGRRIRGAMLDWGMDTAGLQLDSAHPTGTVEVSIEDGEPHYDIVGQRAYDFVEAGALPPIADATLLYHGSLALREKESRLAFLELDRRLRVPRFLDVNLRAPWWQRERVLELMRDAAWVKLNHHELAELTGSPGPDLPGAFGLRSLVLTRGAEGAQWVLPDQTLEVVPEPAEKVVDAVGAGDAFASVILLGLLNGWPEDLALTRAQQFASALVEVRGATVNDRAFYGHFSSVWRLHAST